MCAVVVTSRPQPRQEVGVLAVSVLLDGHHHSWHSPVTLQQALVDISDTLPVSFQFHFLNIECRQ
jgi:hypothetical protein